MVRKIFDKDVFFNGSEKRKVVAISGVSGIVSKVIVDIPGWEASPVLNVKVVDGKGYAVFQENGLEKDQVYMFDTDFPMDKESVYQLILELSNDPGGTGGNVHISMYAKEVG